ncbi:unnamed protein product [Protopolystoma xenopodis]|uniref:Small EDRK-rich factor-like N-terminal domain-containing protein n=1 Tax=Protopolystoma xenopodis TaxID=117903 RepID=A0A3S5B135_9PLAT|nr:unnamed protein product [Protopolystoma xenopodis]
MWCSGEAMIKQGPYHLRMDRAAQEISSRFVFVDDIHLHGGNQRELAREKAVKKEKTKAKNASEHSGNKGLSLIERRER